jgi:addiction module RelE/StbE family toxin
VIYPTDAFERRLTRFLKQHRELAEHVKEMFRKLEVDVHDPKLKTHKLHGKLKTSYTCSVNHNYRIVFKFDEKYVYPDSIGSHDDVY